MGTFGKLLKDERNRLGFTQSELAEIAGLKRRAQIAYESGDRHPDSRYLQRLTEAGFDLQYLFTGCRSINLDEAQEALPVQVNGKDQPSSSIDLELLKKVTAEVLNVMKWHTSVQDMSPEQVASVISVIYNNYQLSGKSPSKEDPSIVSALEIAAVS